MRSWFEFGYHGFPSGEQRQRFYRQRDDPCGSDEDCDYDEETNDRPVFYYPMRESEEESCSSRRSARSSSTDYGESDPPSVPLLSHSTAVESIPSRYGDCVVAMGSAGRQFVLQYGGAALATGEIAPHCHLTELRPMAGSYKGALGYNPVPMDFSLASALNWPLGHPVLLASELSNFAEATTAATTTLPARFGACAAHIPVPSTIASELMTEGYRHMPEALGRSFPQFTRPLLSVPSSVDADKYDLHLSVVIGGCTSVPSPPGASIAQGRTATVSRPEVYFTLLRRSPSAAHWTRGFALDGAAINSLTPRMHATLTPWPCADGGKHSMAYMGGTSNGMEPIPLLAVSVITLSFHTWEWSVSVLETLGTEPCARFGHTTTAVEDKLYVIGGIDRRRQYLSDFHVLDARTLVWREVFMPLSLGMPERAFHCTGCIIASAGTDSPSQLVVVGGESSNGAAVASVWTCTLPIQQWRKATFPLLGQSHSFHVAANAEAVSLPPNMNMGTRLTPAKLFQTVTALTERHASQYQSEGKGAEGLFFATCHGSLPSMVSTAGGGLVVMGGTRSPPVLLAAHIQVPDYSLKESAAMWIFSDYTAAAERINVAAPHLFRHLLAGTSCAHCLTHPTRGGPLADDRSSGAAPPLAEAGEGDSLAHYIHLANQGVLDEQLSQWMRSARKRLGP